MSLKSEELNLSNKFIREGYIIKNVLDFEKLKYISNLILKFSYKELGIINNKSSSIFFDKTETFIKVKDLNMFRVKLHKYLNKDINFKKFFFELSKDYIEILVGNELAMQKKINLSIQLPKDSSSLLDLHSDTWSGDSPYEIVAWLPLVNCYKTKSMYLLPPKKSKNFYKKFSSYQKMSSQQLFRKIKNDVKWINIKYGEVLLFNQSLPHGNVVNNEKDTRWSLNCRFKSLFSPYGDKKLGEFFEPLHIKAATKIGLSYFEPK